MFSGSHKSEQGTGTLLIFILTLFFMMISANSREDYSSLLSTMTRNERMAACNAVGTDAVTAHTIILPDFRELPVHFTGNEDNRSSFSRILCSESGRHNTIINIRRIIAPDASFIPWIIYSHLHSKSDNDPPVLS